MIYIICCYLFLINLLSWVMVKLLRLSNFKITKVLIILMRGICKSIICKTSSLKILKIITFIFLLILCFWVILSWIYIIKNIILIINDRFVLNILRRRTHKITKVIILIIINCRVLNFILTLSHGLIFTRNNTIFKNLNLWNIINSTKIMLLLVCRKILICRIRAILIRLFLSICAIMLVHSLIYLVWICLYLRRSTSF